MPNKKNPFGDGEVTTRFAEFDVFKKVCPCDRIRGERYLSNRAYLTLTPQQLRVLWQMTQLIMMKPENLRPNMEEQKLDDQTTWVSKLHEIAPIELLSVTDSTAEDRAVRLGSKRSRILCT